MTPAEVEAEQLAAAWIVEAVENANPDPEGISDAYSDALDSLIFNDPSRAWLVIKAISRSNLAPEVEASFGMGPLSSFIFHNGLDCRREIRALWDESPRFKEQYKNVVFDDLAAQILN